MILSLFPGIGMLDHAFELEGFTVVRGPDVLWGGDVRRFHPEPLKFEGIIGGDPCQSHSGLANLVRAKGLTPTFPDLTGEYQRVVEEAQPDWFLRENVPRAPDVEPKEYSVTTFLLDNCWLGEAQRRKRRFWFGWDRCDEPAPNLRRWIPGAALECMESSSAQTVSADTRAVPDRHGGSGKVKVTAVGGHDGTADALGNKQYRALRAAKVAPGNGRNEGRLLEDHWTPPRRTLADMLELQGFPPDWMDHQPWTMQAKRKMVGNGVPLPMGRVIARAVRKALE